ncbi:MAG: TasA family protein [Propionicimonas sp.]
MSIRSSLSAHGSAVMGVAVVAVAALGLTAVVTGAVFTDTKTVTANTFTSGSVILGVAPATAALVMSPMVPGDKVTAPITVSNTGTLTYRYAVSSVTTENVLAGALTLNIKSGVTTCDNTGFDATGVAVPTPGPLGSVAGINIFGDPAAGAQGGERTLANGASEVLCAQVSMPLGSGNELKAITSTAVFTFAAEQTVNN